MAIIYTYPKTSSVNAEDTLLISNKDQQNKTMNVRVRDIFDLIPDILDLNEFNLYGKPFGDPTTTPKPGDTINYDGDNWVTGPAGTSKTEIIPVTATTVANNYEATVANINELQQDVVYKTTFDLSNTISPVTLDINSYGAKNIQRGTLNGFEDVPINFIVSGLEYFLTYNGSIFQIHTSNPETGASTEFVNPDPTTQTIGGIPKGSTFPRKNDGSGYTMQDMWDQLLYPYQLPALKNLSIDGIANTLEVGQTISAGNYDFNWGVDNVGNILANSGVITDTTTGITLLSNVPIESTTEVSVTLPAIQKTVFNATHSFNIVGQNTQGGNISPASATYRWLWKRYVGNDNADTIPAVTIQGLSVNNALSSNLNGTYSFPGGGYKYLCIPIDFPEPNKITMGGIDVSMADGSNASSAAYNIQGSGPYKFAIVSVTNQFNQPINYRVYRSLNKLNGAATFIVS